MKKKNTRTENRAGVEIEITELDGDTEKWTTLNTPVELTGYCDKDTRDLTAFYETKIFYVNKGENKIGNAFPENERSLEAVVHPIVTLSTKFSAFIGFEEGMLPTVAEVSNYFLRDVSSFRTRYDKETMAKAIEAGYVRSRDIEGSKVHFPTEKAVKAMCDSRMGLLMYSLGLHTGTTLGGTFRKLPHEGGSY